MSEYENRLNAIAEIAEYNFDISDEKFGEKTRELRKLLGLTMREVSAKTNVTISTISKIENGDMNCYLISYCRLKEFYIKYV